MEYAKLIYFKNYNDFRGCLSVLEVDEDFYFNVKQINTSFTKKRGTIKGLHFQVKPYLQGKLVTCYKGSVINIALDLRKKSKEFGKYKEFILKEKDNKALYIPRGYAHGYITLEDDTFIQYCVDNLFQFDCTRSIKYDDKNLNIDWHLENFGNDFIPILSDKDKNALDLEFFINKEGGL